jgi:group I intron endonuclease
MEKNIQTPVIYKTTNLLNGKIYVGQDKYNRRSYYGSGKILKQSIKKYGKYNFQKEILEYCSLEVLNDREIFWIKELDATNPEIGYNLTTGGNFNVTFKGHKHSESTIQKMKEKSVGKNKGISRPKELRELWSSQRKGKAPWNKGKKGISEETRKKLSLAGKNRVISDDTRKKLSESKKGVKARIVTCPHCKKEGGINNMHRYHFDNCKLKTNDYI